MSPTIFLNAICAYLLLSAVCTVLWAVRVRTLNGSEYSRMLMLLCAALCFYLLGYAMELNSGTPSQITFWNHVEFLGIPFVSALWLTTSLMYTGHLTSHKKLLMAAIFIIPVITLVLRFTNDYHHLYFASLTFVEDYGSIFLLKKPGPWLYVQMIHSMSAILLAMGLFMRDALKAGEGQRGKVVLTLSASTIAIAGLILAAVKPLSLPIDYMAVCLPLAVTAIALAITRYDFLETKSIAKNRAFDASESALLLMNGHYKILDYNKRARALFSLMDITLGNGYITTLLSEQKGLCEALTQSESSIVALQTVQGQRFYRITTTRVDDSRESRGWIKTMSDVTETCRLNEELERQALTDDLSTLSNRRAFIKIGRSWVSRVEQSNDPLYLLMMDLDHFKSINDRYGHPAGDMVIRRFSGIMRNAFLSDCLIARLGGEEFAILSRASSDASMHQRVQVFLQKTRQETYRYGDHQFQVTVSAGMTKKQPGQTLESMMGKADEALYQSKEQGRDRLIVI